MLMIAAILLPAIGGPLISNLHIEERLQKILYVICIALTDIAALSALGSSGKIQIAEISTGVQLIFQADTLSRCFVPVTVLLFTCILFYAYEYMTMEERRPLFYTFYFISMGAVIAECFAGNLVTMYLSFEFMTLMSMPLVLHERTKEAVAAGLKYLFYSIAGAMMGLLAVFFIYHYAGQVRDFAFGGFLDPAKVAGQEVILRAAVLLGIIGFGAKAGMYPLHGWLPTAHPIAPAPASALLSAMIAKGGILAVIRLVYYSVGTSLLKGSFVQYVWMTIALLTIFMGSMMAFRETILKKRLAYSTISQLSYIMLGLSLMSEEGLTGGLLHVFGHAAAKASLFMAAGTFIYKLGIRSANGLRGVGKRMPLTLAAFTTAAISLVGIPPMAGFTSKWVIASAALNSGSGVYAVIGPVMLLISALLTAGYLLPIMVDGYFPGGGAAYTQEDKKEPGPLMLVPMFVLCAAALIVGLFGGAIMSRLTF